MKYFFTFFLVLSSCLVFSQVRPKVVVECTVEYSIDQGEQAATDVLKQTSIVLYVKNNMSRVDFINPSFTQKKIFDNKKGSGVILQEMGSTKVMRNIDSLKWIELNRKYDGAAISYSDEKKTILGYECRKAIITLKDGTAYNLYYATAIIPSTTAYEYQFRNIPGFVLEYETVAEGSGQKVRYTASKINLSPVPASRFELPKAGYRVL